MFGKPLIQKAPRQTKRKCEIVVEKTARGTKKSIRGDCQPAEIKALSGDTTSVD